MDFHCRVILRACRRRFSWLYVRNAGISGQPEGATPGQPTGNPGAWQGICSKGMPHTRGIRALWRFWQNTPGAYPRDLHVICCLNVQRFSPQDKQARSIDILRPLCPRGITTLMFLSNGETAAIIMSLFNFRN